MEQRKMKSWNYLGLAFLIPFGGMLLVMAAGGCMPFGTGSMMYADMSDQYYPFFLALRKAVRSGNFQNIIYTWNIGMGMDFLGLIAYYLTSPLYLVGFVLPESVVLGYYCLLMPVKLGIAGMSFAYMLGKFYNNQKLELAVFGGFYGLCAWVQGYHWNIMWLDTFAILPLAVLGTVCLLRDKKCWLYTVVLCMSIICNYVMGLFTCIFIFLLFFGYQICKWAGWKSFFSDLANIAVVSLLAIGMTAVVEVPALMALQTAAADAFPAQITLNFTENNTVLGIVEALVKVASNMGGGIPPTVMAGLPNIYCGVFAVFFLFLYFFSKNIPIREKICAAAALLFIDLSFIIVPLDYIWHGFHFTKLIPHRFSYLHSFLVLVMAYRAWMVKEKFSVWQIIAAGILSVGLLATSECIALRTPIEIGSLYFFIPPYMMFNAAFLGLYGLVMLVSNQTLVFAKWRNGINRYMSPILLGILCVELATSLWCFRTNFTGIELTNYPLKGTDTARVIQTMKMRETDTKFFRAEMTHGQTQNDSTLNGYNGTSAFASTSNMRLIEFMRGLGYSAMDYWNRYLYEEGSPVSDLFLGLKYRIAREESDRSSRFFQEVYRSGDVVLLENERYLPLGFLTEKALAEIPFRMEEAGSPFPLQNALFQAMSGVKGQIWKEIQPATVSGEDLTITDRDGKGYTAFRGDGKDASLTYSYQVGEEGFLCLYLTFPNFNRLNVLLNGVQLYQEEIGPPQMLAVGDVESGDVVEVQILSYAGQEGSVTIEAAVMDCELFDRGYDVLKASTLELTKFESTYVEGKILCDRDGLLYTSIPQNGNWTAKVDGKDAPIQLIGDCMIGLELEEGEHTVSFTYRNAAFSLGWKISVVCAAIFLAVAVQKQKQGRYQK